MSSGADLGSWEADDEQGALDAMSRAAGYRNHAHACAQFTVEPGELRVTAEGTCSAADTPSEADPARMRQDQEDDARIRAGLEAIRTPRSK